MVKDKKQSRDTKEDDQRRVHYFMDTYIITLITCVCCVPWIKMTHQNYHLELLNGTEPTTTTNLSLRSDRRTPVHI